MRFFAVMMESSGIFSFVSSNLSVAFLLWKCMRSVFGLSNRIVFLAPLSIVENGIGHSCLVFLAFVLPITMRQKSSV